MGFDPQARGRAELGSPIPGIQAWALCTGRTESRASLELQSPGEGVGLIAGPGEPLFIPRSHSSVS